jgi:DNA helicase II / ATP-dependent DNA helicase PcrA
MFQLRPAQEKILAYENGRLAISAVPGSGKTFTLSLLAAQLIENGRVTPQSDQQILIVTYLNASVDTFKARIRQQLMERDLPPTGFDVRTLHSLALEILRTAHGSLDDEAGAFVVLDEGQSSHFLALAVDGWIESHPDLWHAFLPDNSPRMKARWRDITEQTARAFIRSAKNERYGPEEIRYAVAGGQYSVNSSQYSVNSEQYSVESEKLKVESEGGEWLLLRMMAEIYGRYQTILTRQGAHDFDDLIWEATRLLEERPGLSAQLRQRWPTVLEDEAQDSVPLQEILLNQLTGPDGNWVRVGDPNQAITSTFTAAHPRYFNAFTEREDVVSLPLPNSGRSAPLIIGAANAMLHWVIDHHPVPEVAQHTFRRQEILPTPPGDAQPNPPDSEADIRLKVFKHREDEELPRIAQLGPLYAAKYPDHTLAILVPTNQIGYQIADYLDEAKAPYDNLLRSSGREREIAAAMHALLALLAEPLNTKALVNAHTSLRDLGHPAALTPGDDDLNRFYTLLRSAHRPESLLFPWDETETAASLPNGVATEDDLDAIGRFVRFIQPLFELRALPIDDLALTLGDELFARGEVHEGDLSLAYQIATLLRRWRDMEPEWRLPELVAELEDVATGRRRLPVTSPTDLGYEPQPGRITLATQHSAKGLEWDAVFLVGIDGFWIPGSLEAPFLGVHDFLGGDPTAEVVAQLRYLMAGEAGTYPGRTPTETAHIDIISERLRLLYVGITRARRYLHISRSRATRRYNREQNAEPATVLGVLYQYLKREA